MTFRILCSVTLVALAACGKSESKSPNETTAAGAAKTADSSAGRLAADSAAPARDPLPQNHLGKIPVLEYHVIGGEKNALYTRTVASFKADLEDVYRRGYRPITIAQMLDKNFADVPAGMSPVVFVFDDASPEQFSYIENNGKLTVDPNSAVGIWLDFAKTHPGWKNRATFCMLNGGAAGHNGIRSMISHIGEDFRRVRIGIGHPGHKDRVTGHVLGNYHKSEVEPLTDLLGAIAAEAPWLADGDDVRFQNDLALRLNG